MTYRYDKMGAVTVPATGSVATGGTLITLLDPTIEYLLAAFKDVINGKLGSVWAAGASQISRTGSPVVGTYNQEPLPMLAKRTWQWPALFMWRQKERLFKRTQVYRCAESEGKLLYVLPPLPYETAKRLHPIRVGVRTALDLFIEQYGDPGVNSGADPMAAKNIESFEFVSDEYAWLAGDAIESPHAMLEFTWRMRERQSFVDANYSPLEYVITTVEAADERPATSATSGVDVSTMYFPIPGSTAASGFTPGFSAGFH